MVFGEFDIEDFSTTTTTKIKEVTIMMLTDEELEKRFTYHPPKGDQAQRYAEIREMAKEFAVALALRCPESRELSLALTSLEDVVYRANAAIARNE